MSKEVHNTDFTDEELTRFFESVSRLTWSSITPVPAWVGEQADAFGRSPPRPTPAELRQHIDHAVAVARGWDDPDNKKVMLHAAIKSFYLIRWLEHLQKHSSKRTDLAMGYRVNFTPNVANADVG